jgi:hypothetical protein
VALRGRLEERGKEIRGFKDLERGEQIPNLTPEASEDLQEKCERGNAKWNPKG